MDLTSRWRHRVSNKGYKKRPQADANRICAICKTKFGASTIHTITPNTEVWNRVSVVAPLDSSKKFLRICCCHFIAQHPKRVTHPKWVAESSRDLPWFCSINSGEESSSEIRTTRSAFTQELKRKETEYLKSKEKPTASKKKARSTPSTIKTRASSSTFRESLNLPSEQNPLYDLEESLVLSKLSEFEFLAAQLEVEDPSQEQLLRILKQYILMSSGRKDELILLREQLRLITTLNNQLQASHDQLAENLSRVSSYSFRAMAARDDLYFFTGFRSADIIQRHLIDPTREYMIKHNIRLRQARVPLENRVCWLMMWMWMDLSVLQLLDRISHDYRNSRGELKSDRGLRKLLDATASIMAACFKDQLQLPSPTEWKSMNVAIGKQTSFNEVLTFVIDGTSLPIRQPSNHRGSRATYVSYKKHNAYRYFIVTTLNGEIVYLSQFAPGRATDSKMYEESTLKRDLEKHYDIESILSEGITRGFALGGDKGYATCKPPSGWELLITKSGINELRSPTNQMYPEIDDGEEPMPLPETVPWKRTFTTTWAEPRSVVEISVGIVKRWKKLSNGTIL